MKHAELFSGYGGLGLAVETVFGAELAWHAEFDPAPSKIMARHWPDAPNYGDVTTVDWASVEPVDIISGGSPCQDVSAAGRRAGMNEGTRSNLWVAMREAIATIKPTYVVWENVRGAHSAKAYSAVESEPGLLGESRGAYLRATGRVVGDLAELGYDAEWRTVSAASVGAPHRRERVFVLAWRRDSTAPDRDGRRDRGRNAPPRQGGGERADTQALLAARVPGRAGPTDPVALLPTVTGSDMNGAGAHGTGGPDLRTVTSLLPTPRASRGASTTETAYALGAERSDDERPQGEVLLPTPKAGDGEFGLPRTSGRPPEMSTHLATRLHYTDFGLYASAIHRWEEVTGRPAPSPTELSPRGKHRLSEHFTEWMMGLPEGWICETEGITRNDKLKAAGNGVVPQQAAAALADMLRTSTQERNTP